MSTRTRIEVDWGHLAVVTAAMVILLAYFYDVRATSLDLQNLIFVQPMIVIAVVLYLVILSQIIRRVPDGPVHTTKAVEEPVEVTTRETWPELGRIGLVVVAFGFFVFGVETIGFDVCSWVFITVGLYACGERNPLALAVFPVLATVILFYGFSVLVPYPMPTLVL